LRDGDGIEAGPEGWGRNADSLEGLGTGSSCGGMTMGGGAEGRGRRAGAKCRSFMAGPDQVGAFRMTAKKTAGAKTGLSTRRLLRGNRGSGR
jgi:hypothetical protein